MKLVAACFVVLLLVLGGCFEEPRERVIVSRGEKIPGDAVKMTPEIDGHPPKMHSSEYAEPVPLRGDVNTAGAEDSPFIPAGSDELYFFFTPDVQVPVEKQVIDDVTGIYVSRKQGGEWKGVERVFLQDPGKLSLDGCEFVQGQKMLFCTAREGYTGLHWFSAERKEGEWGNWENADFPEEYGVGELHISSDGGELYFHSSREGGKGGRDIWVSRKTDGGWGEPENVEIVNSAEDEAMPFLTGDGKELWFNRRYLGTPGIFRSRREGGEWGEPELIISQFAGEPTVDDEGNIYFVHHFYENGKMIEADIYVAKRK